MLVLSGGNRRAAAVGAGNEGGTGRVFFAEQLTAFRAVEAVEHGGSQVAGRAVEDDFAFLQETATLMMSFDTIPCNDCKYCMPCPYGLDIPAILLHYNKCLNERNIPESTQDAGYRKARRAFLVGYDRSVPKLRQASHCTGCNRCSPHCPQRINIPGELHRIDAYVERLRQEIG